ncbi:MAG: type I-E CRISPR-associated protein Cas7/Cse4/CasC [Acidobacteriota bacterium]
MPSKFLQIHTLTSYPATLLNRDDAGFAKRLPFGGSTRLRVSSQCLKRHWRRSESDHALGQIAYDEGTAPLTVRSRLTFHREIYQPLLADGVAEERAYAVTEALIDALLGKSKGRAAKAAKDSEEAFVKATEDALGTGQVTVLGRPEVEWLKDRARDFLAAHDEPKAIQKAVKEYFKKDAKKNLAQLADQLGMGLDAALFGRMVTSDILARYDAAVHVAHAFTVHAAEIEPDYFSAVDDIVQAEGELGSGHINTMELTSGLYYSYVVIDVPLLVSNLEGCARQDWSTVDRTLAAEVVRRFVHLVATTTPGAKLGSTAPYSVAQMMVVEAGAEAPRTLANAFAEPVRSSGQIVSDTYDRLTEHLADLDQVYGAPSDGRQALALGPKERLGQAVGRFVNLGQLAEWSAEKVAE